MELLAIKGGKPVRTKSFPPYRTLDEREENAVLQVLREGILSDFVGADSPFFYGGKKVRELEELFKKNCGTKHAVAMNSATSVIIAAMGAFGVGPGDEVLVSPYSHVISATAPLVFDAIPVMVDSEPDYFCMSVNEISKAITPRTKAMIVVDLFGQSAAMDEIMALAERHNILVLSDSAHITSATYKGRMAGTLAHIGSYSFNSHKTIQCGEGGIAVTNSDELALKLQLLRNHAENCVAGMKVSDITNMVGYNFRMTEIEAAIAIEQTKKKDVLVKHRRMLCEYLLKKLNGIRGIKVPEVREGCTHDWLLFCIKYDAEETGISIETLKKLLDAEGISSDVNITRHVPAISGFVKPIHLQPLFQKKQFRPKGFPWAYSDDSNSVSYAKGCCPVVEDLYDNSLLAINAIYPPLTTDDMDDIVFAFKKVLECS